MVQTSLKYKLFAALAILIIVASCKTVKRLSNDDRAWMPYKGNETLVYTSNFGDIDTVFLIGKDTSWHYPDPMFSLSKNEVLSVYSKFKDIYDDSGSYRYLQGTFVSIKRTMNKSSELFIDLNAKDATYYRISLIRLDSLETVEPISLTVVDNNYNDVYVFLGEYYLDIFRERSDFITKVYWSKSAGVIRYEKDDGEYWELTQKY